MEINAKKPGRPATGRKQSLQVSVDADLLAWLQQQASASGESISSCARRLLLQIKRQQ